MTPKLSIIILAGNEQEVILDCLKCAQFADEVIMVAANSTDNTIALTKEFYPKTKIIITNDQYNKNFSKWRNLGFEKSKFDWVFYLDSDERITAKLQSEILQIISKPQIYTHFAIPRANHYLGKRVRHGGSYPDFVIRLYHRPYFKGYLGDLHEQPVVSGNLGYLKNDLLHFTHRQLTAMLCKSIAWSDTEAQLLFAFNHPPVVWWRFPRMMCTKFWERYLKQSFWLDGKIGIISTIFEMFNTYMIYARLYELQQSKKA